VRNELFNRSLVHGRTKAVVNHPGDPIDQFFVRHWDLNSHKKAQKAQGKSNRLPDQRVNFAALCLLCLFVAGFAYRLPLSRPRVRAASRNSSDCVSFRSTRSTIPTTAASMDMS